MSEDEMLVSKEIAKNSLSICVFSALESLGFPSNAPIVPDGAKLMEALKISKAGFGPNSMKEQIGRMPLQINNGIKRLVL